MAMKTLEIHQIPVLNDNYVYLVREPTDGVCAAVDPALAQPVLEALGELGWSLTHILNTHHHWDHTGGNLEIKRATGCTVVGPRAEAARIPGIDVALTDGELYRFGSEQAEVLDIPGHTRGHIAYWFARSRALFCGDTLFALGCGRLFEGTPTQMWGSLTKLRELPGDTRVYCAHEYTQTNARFALTVEPDNAALKARAEKVNALRAEGKPTVPSTMEEERRTNPFLRADDARLQHAIGMDGADPVMVFAEVRHRKDSF
jgi:hydroxyacylglutathione hydrolase